MKEKNCCEIYMKETNFERCPNCGENLDFKRRDTAEQALLIAAGEGDAEASKKAFDGGENEHM